jgi:hypothetical protein
LMLIFNSPSSSLSSSSSSQHLYPIASSSGALNHYFIATTPLMRLSFFSVSEAFYFISYCSHHSLNSQKQNGSVNYPCYHLSAKRGGGSMQGHSQGQTHLWDGKFWKRRLTKYCAEIVSLSQSSNF